MLGLDLSHKKEIWIWIGTGTIRAWRIIFKIEKLFKNNYSSFKSEILKSLEFQHTLHVGNDFEEVAFFYSAVVSETSTQNLNGFIT